MNLLMPNTELDASENELLLEGGPKELPLLWHTDHVVTTHEKIPHWSGLEHYEFTGQYRDFQERRLPVFQWVYTTKVAE